MSDLLDLHFSIMAATAAPAAPAKPAEPVEMMKVAPPLVAIERVALPELPPEGSPKQPQKSKAKHTWVSGFCGIGCHEGTKKLSAKGSLMKACRGTYYVQYKPYKCNCDCHVVFAEIAALTGMHTSEATATVAEFSSDNSVLSSTDGDTVAPTAGDGPLTAPVGTLSRPIGSAVSVSTAPMQTFSPTASGYRQRGQLEAELAAIAIKWFGNSTREMPVGLTPEVAGSAVQSGKPSNGAIYSCFVRWERQGYVTLGKKPFRIKNMTESGLRSLARWA